MELTVVNAKRQEPWYAEGLRFACTQCGNCCTGKPGFVWIEEDEIARLAELLSLSIDRTVEKYCRRIGGRISLKENFNPRGGGYDCVFLKEIPPAAASAAGEVAHSRRVCSIYSARPAQCRAWPFWDSNLASLEAWQFAGQRCPGIGRGELHARDKIEAARDQTSTISR
jgi:Fe-S-cluster containining protein